MKAIKNGQSRDKGNQEWTIQRQRQSRMDNPETKATLDTKKRRIKTNITKITKKMSYTELTETIFS